MKRNKILILTALFAAGMLFKPGFAADLNAKEDISGYYNVLKFGAKADGKAKDTPPVQAAIDACFTSGGGTVYFPAGTFLCGSIHLKSNVALYLDHGAILKMSPDNEDFDKYETLGFKNASDKETSYFHYALIWGEDVEHIAILGTGIIDGNRVKRGGPKPIALKRCKEVTIRDITIKNSPNYCISMLGTDFVNISGVSILNGYCDGIDPDACQNVRISDCYIDCFDDAIVPKASFSLGYLRAVENLTVTNCILASNCNAFKFGTETGGNFKNVTVSNCTVLARKVGKPADSGIALESVDGSEVEGVTITNIAMQDIISPIFIRLGNRGRDMETPTPGYLKNVIISNITAINATQTSMIVGIPGFPVENVTIDNVRISYAGGGSYEGKVDGVPELINEYPDSDMFGPMPVYGFYCRHAKNIKLSEIDMDIKNPDNRPAFYFEDIENLKLESVHAERSEGAPAVMHFKDSRKVIIRNCEVPKDISKFINDADNSKNSIQLLDNYNFEK